MKAQIATHSAKHRRGFALVVTLALMILLTVIAVGLLTLSSISLRTSSQAQALETARANARLGLMLAIGELQKNLGPDQRISASGAVMDDPTSAPPNEMARVAGAWQSWKINPASPPGAGDFKKTGGKSAKFLNWLVSHPDPEATKLDSFAKSPNLSAAQRTTMVPALKSSTSTLPEVYAGLVPVTAKGGKNKPAGAYAYVVLDEGAKARIDTGFEPVEEDLLGDQALALGTGVRADSSKITGLEKINWPAADLTDPKNLIGNAISYSSGGLLLKSLGGTNGDDYKSLFHDITLSSVGLFTDVANGGLKEDLNSILNANTLPADLSGRGIYKTALNYTTTTNATIGQTDPGWLALQKFSNLYQNGVSKSGSSPMVAMQAPTGWTASVNPPPAATQTTATLMPTVAKIQIFFSYVACPLRRGDNSAAQPFVFGNFNTQWSAGARYLLYLVYTPIVTLHNPYNATLDLKTLTVEIRNVPMMVQTNRNNAGWQPASPLPVQSLYQGANGGVYQNNKSFKFSLQSATGSTASIPLQPGEVAVFSPVIPATASFQSDRDTPAANRVFTDTQDGNASSVADYLNTANQKAKRGFRSTSIGYALDWANWGNPASGDPLYQPNGSANVFAGDLSQSFKVRFRPVTSSQSTINKGIFTVEMSKTSGSPAPSSEIYSALKFDFSAAGAKGNYMNGLAEALGYNDNDWIESPLNISTGNIAVKSSSAPISDFPVTGCFAMITASQKTTLGNKSNDGTNYDGRYSAKPWSFNSAVSPYMNQTISKNMAVHPAQYPYELDVVAIDASSGYGSNEFVNTSKSGQGYAVTGNTETSGKPYATTYEIPVAPLQTLPELNSAGLANGNYLTRYVSPVGNSWTHPMLRTSAITAPSPDAKLAPLYDHSFLLNLALYDRYYFSGIAPRAGTFMTAAKTQDLATTFFDPKAKGPALTDKRLTPWLPIGKTMESAVKTLSDDSEITRRQAAAYQLMKGAFNVNSTSKEAWKAMLASRFDGEGKGKVNEVSATGSNVTDLRVPNSGHTRFSRFRIPNSQAVDSKNPDAQRFFQGPVDITEKQLDDLASRIVEQVRARGPFLSMAEFVNRQLGPTGDLTLKGALQAAIDETDINSRGTETGYDISQSHVSKYKLTTPEAAYGRSDQGAPGSLTQADLLATLGNAATVRSDTFRIRTCGEARDSRNVVIARVWCEAVVQRVPDFVSPLDEPHVAIANLTSAANKTFGRKFIVTSFRWLHTAEVKS